MKTFLICITACMLSLPASVLAQSKSTVISKGPRFEIKKILKEESTTVVLFIQDTSTIEQQFLIETEKHMPINDKVVLDVARIKDLKAPAAEQYKITATPTAIVFDRFGREIDRSSEPSKIMAAIHKGQLMGRIKWIDEDDPRAPEVYGAPAEAMKRGIPGIVKAMGQRPEALKMFNIMSEIHFSDGFLKRREHEMIGAYVSYLDKCKFCLGSHASALQKQGFNLDIVDAIATGDLSKAALTPKDQAMMTYVSLLTLTPSRTTDADVEALRVTGWTDEQIWEMSYEVALFSFANRMADAHGLDYPTGGWYPPSLREKMAKEILDKEKLKGN